MKTFFCDSCGGLVFFENVKCLSCGHELGFLPEAMDLCALEPADKAAFRALRHGEGAHRRCQNGFDYQACNWMVSTDDSSPFCVACRLNEMIPDLSTSGNLERWHKLEKAKRRIVYTILRLGLPVTGAAAAPALRFKFLGDAPGAPVMTGHANGLITINIAEADDDERERRRANLHEPYRTVLGHLRHEVAHYYWDRLVANSPWEPGFRKFFGDETVPYDQALQRYYQNGPQADWQDRFVSAYASAHPWEDWAETWAHYFHIIDMVETAAGFGLALRPKHPSAPTMTARPRDPFDAKTSLDEILENWFPLTYALNSLNRGMGLSDAYPFVLSNPAIEKLRFVHDVARQGGGSAES